MESKYKLGQAVLFINDYGMTYNKNYVYKWGEVLIGFVSKIEFIEARNSYIYTVGTVSSMDSEKPMYRILGEHYIFELDQEDIAVLKMKEFCEEPDSEQRWIYLMMK